MKHLSKRPDLTMRRVLLSDHIYLFMVFCILSLSSKIFADHIEWDDGSQLKVKGSGCPEQHDVMYLSVGDSFSLIMTKMNVHLSGQQGPMSSKKECKFEIPATVESGYYVSTMFSDVHYGYVRTEKTLGVVSAKFDFLGNRFKYEDYIGLRGNRDTNVPHTSMRNNSKFLSIFGDLCKGRSTKNTFKGHLVTWAQRSRKDESILIQADGVDIRFELESQLVACPQGRPERPFPFLDRLRN